VSAAAICQAEVDAAADRLMARGDNPTVRVLCAELKKSPNVVGFALRQWRSRLQGRIKEGLIVPGLPPEVLEWVRLGYEAGKRTAPLTEATSEPRPQERALRQVNSALRSQVEEQRTTRAALQARNRELEGQLVEARIRNAEFERQQEALQAELDEAHRAIGELRAVLASARARTRARRARTNVSPARGRERKPAGKAASRRTGDSARGARRAIPKKPAPTRARPAKARKK
jgi:septal ring factor EnvC (AmiA/AmiB activator)